MTLTLREIEQAARDSAVKKETLRSSLGIDTKRQRLEEVAVALNDPAIWGSADKMGTFNKEKRMLENSLSLFNILEKELEELAVLIELGKEDDSLLADGDAIVAKVSDAVRKLEFQKMLGGANDSNNAFISINAGAGGRESQDWAVMLCRMYVRWAERRRMQIEEIDRVTGDDAAGIKNVTMMITGDYAYGFLKAEIGVHRLVRISPFDANQRRHTSFASVYVTPEIDDSIDIEVAEADLKIDTFRAGGAGGQHINKTDSAVRITHMPTGIVVQCQNERSQHKNKATAMKILKSKLYELELSKKAAENEAAEKQKMEINFGSQIRSYVLHPYKMVKDHRYDFETGNAEAVLDGEEILDRFMEDFLLRSGAGK